MAIITDVTQEYMDRAKPGSGTIVYETGYRRQAHEDEIRTAKWLIETFGGNVMLLREHRTYGIRTPDFLWRGATWELKDISSNQYGTIDKRIQKACKQLQEYPLQGQHGGIILDFTGNRLPMEKIKGYVIQSAKARMLHGTNNIIIKKGAEYIALQIKRE